MNKTHLVLILLLSIPLLGLSNITINDIQTAIIKQDFETAQALAQQLLSRDDQSQGTEQEALYYLGLSSLRLKQYPQAEDFFEDLISKETSEQLRDKAYLGLFNAQYMQSDYRDALRTVKKLERSNSKSQFTSLIYLKLARVNLKLANWTEARKYLRRIVNEYPDSLEVYAAKQLLEEKQFFAVQVGSFMERERAAKLAEELKRKKEYAYIVETLDKNSRKFYRVRVGQLTVLDEARKLKSKLAKQGYPTKIYP